MKDAARIEAIARVAHAANAAWCEQIGEESLPWEDVRDSAIDGVQNALLGATPRESHQNWCDFKIDDGWEYGPVKDPVAKTHPCLVPYDELPDEQRVKDALFTGIVSALAP